MHSGQVTALNAAANEYERREVAKGTKLPGVCAICVNEDNNGPDVFEKLENGKVQICYASPEILLKHQRFKKLFRLERFCTSVPAIFVDEAHVISEWKDEFWRSYADLEDLLTLCGTQTPCGAFTASALTDTFEVVYSTLKMGVN
jgi:superfamily II DNA helicase RecQ